jgi:hypothetical protein
MNREDLTADLANQMLAYSPADGTFMWLVRDGVDHATKIVNARFAGKAAGCIDHRSGYRYIRIRGFGIYAAHRLAWLMRTGSWPTDEIDHRDRDGGNNRWSNLREASRSENGANRGVHKHSKSGLKGVYWDADRGLWAAEIRFNRKRQHLGRFARSEDATRAYAEAAASLHGEFARVA